MLLQIWLDTFFIGFPASTCLFKVNNRNIRKRCEICSKLTIKTPERRHWRFAMCFASYTPIYNHEENLNLLATRYSKHLLIADCVNFKCLINHTWFDTYISPFTTPFEKFSFSFCKWWKFFLFLQVHNCLQTLYRNLLDEFDLKFDWSSYQFEFNTLQWKVLSVYKIHMNMAIALIFPL